MLRCLTLCAALLTGLLGANSHAADPDAEIQHLLRHVAGSECTFVRNGTRHTAADAASHLRLKYNRGRRYADSAEHFIDRLASESSWTGRAYTIECAGRVSTTGPWLHRALAAYRQASP